MKKNLAVVIGILCLIVGIVGLYYGYSQHRELRKLAAESEIMSKDINGLKAQNAEKKIKIKDFITRAVKIYITLDNGINSSWDMSGCLNAKTAVIGIQNRLGDLYDSMRMFGEDFYNIKVENENATAK